MNIDITKLGKFKIEVSSDGEGDILIHVNTPMEGREAASILEAIALAYLSDEVEQVQK